MKLGPIEAMREMDMLLGVMLFVAMPTAAGAQEGVPLFGFGLGMFFLAFMVLMKMSLG